MERLVEQVVLVAPVYKAGMERPIEVLAAGDAHGLHRAQRIEHAAGPDRQSRRAQRARKLHQICDEAAVAGLVSGNLHFSTALVAAAPDGILSSIYRILRVPASRI